MSAEYPPRSRTAEDGRGICRRSRAWRCTFEYRGQYIRPCKITVVAKLMRSWSIHVGRLFGVEVRLHLTFLLLPLFVFWTEYNVHGSANGPRDLALVGIVLACVAAHEVGHMLVARRVGIIPKAVILLPLSGVTVFDESHMEKAESPAAAFRRELRIALAGPLVNLGFAILAALIVMAVLPGAKIWEWPW